MSVILRVDDFPYTKPDEQWRHKLENFKKFDAILKKNGVSRYVLGVIPKLTSDDQLYYLQSNPKIQIAMHGIQHDERFLNEFHSFKTEADITREIYDINLLLGLTQHYIPPHNVIDRRTVNALKACGFSTIYCGPGTDRRVQIYAEDVGLKTYYSEHPIWYGRSDELMNRDNAVEKILNSDHNVDHVLTLHWTWETNIGLKSLDQFLNLIREVLQ